MSPLPHIAFQDTFAQCCTQMTDFVPLPLQPAPPSELPGSSLLSSFRANVKGFIHSKSMCTLAAQRIDSKPHEWANGILKYHLGRGLLPASSNPRFGVLFCPATSNRLLISRHQELHAHLCSVIRRCRDGICAYAKVHLGHLGQVSRLQLRLTVAAGVKCDSSRRPNCRTNQMGWEGSLNCIFYPSHTIPTVSETR